MPRSSRLLSIICLTALVHVPIVGPAFADGNSTKQPHIVIYLSDDHGQEFVGCYGNASIKTPHLDRLARQGLKMNRVFAVTSSCAPSRSVLFTGLYPARNGAMANHTSCRDDVRSLPAYLKPLGYRVVLANKTHIAPAQVFDFEFLPARLPPDERQSRRYRSEGLDVGKIDQFLQSHAAKHPQQPLCLILADDNPHVLWEKNKTYDESQLPLSPILVDTPKTRTALANYYQDITTMDERVGRVRASLAKHGYADNTLFVYTSDQGSEWPKSKWTVYDAGLQVPFLAVWPGRIQPGSNSEAMTSFVDFTPTLIDIAGGAAPDEIDGTSFLSVLLGRSDSYRDFVYGTHTGDGKMNDFPQRCVRGERFKFVLNLKPEKKWKTHFTEVAGIPHSHRDVYATWLAKAQSDTATARLIDVIENHPEVEFYDLQADPYELNNLASDPDYAESLRAHRQRLEEWMTKTGDEGLATERREAARDRIYREQLERRRESTKKS